MGELTGKKILGEVEVLETSTSGHVGRKGGVDGVVEEGDKSEVGETAEKGRERAGKVGVGEVERVDGVGNGVANHPRPVAWGGVAFVPGGEGGVRVFEGVLEALEVKALLVERDGERRTRKEEEKEKEKHCC